MTKENERGNMGKERKKLTLEEAQELLPEGDTVHTFRQGSAMLIGADWSKERIMERIKTHGIELAGEQARRLNHGLCSHDDAHGWLFVETRREKQK